MGDIERDGLGWREAGTGPCIALLHGLGGSRTSWDSVIGALHADHRVAAWDAPGYGVSEALGAPLTFAAMADAVERWCDALGEDRVHLVGHSFGGMIAQHAAHHHPDRIASLTLVATSPAFGLDGTSPDAWRAARLAPLDAGEEPAAFAERVLTGVAGPGLTIDALREQCAAMGRISADGLRAAIELLVTHDSRPFLAEVRVPTAVVVGQLDDETPPAYADAIATAIPAARVVRLEGVGHLVPAEAPEQLAAVIREHVREQGDRS